METVVVLQTSPRPETCYPVVSHCSLVELKELQDTHKLCSLFYFFDTHQMVSHPEPELSLLQLCCMGRRELWLVSMYEGSQN